MKRIFSLLLVSVLLISVCITSACGVQTVASLGWNAAGEDFSGWSLEEDVIVGDYATMKSNRIWKNCIEDMRNFTLNVDISSSNVSSPYLKVMGVVVELDANNGDGNSVFIKVNGEFKEWIAAAGTLLHVQVSRVKGGDLTISLTGEGSDQATVYTATPASASEYVEIGMYRGGCVRIANLSVVNTNDGTDAGPAIDSNALVNAVLPEETFSCDGWTWENGSSLQSDGAAVTTRAVYLQEKLSGNWSVSCDVTMVSTQNAGRAVCRMDIVDGSGASVLLITLENRLENDQLQLTCQIPVDGQWETLWCSGWQTAGEDTLSFRLEKQSDTVLLLQLTGQQGFALETTLQLSAEKASRVAMATERSVVQITNFALDAQFPQRDYAALSKQTFDNLMKNYLDTANNRIYAVRWGFKNGDVTNTGKTVSITDVGEVWESTVMMMALDTYAQTLDQDSEEYRKVAQVIANTVNALANGYGERITIAAQAPNYAMDDCGWNVMGLLLGYHYNKVLGDNAHSQKCLQYAKALFNSTYETFYSDAMGGLSYTTARADVSLYGATMALAGYYLNQIQQDDTVEQRYLAVYNGIETVLGRPDGLYWCGATVTGADGISNPYGIGEAGSCSYIGGNMAMAVLNTLMGNEELAERTALGILRYETYANGAFMNDRDAWNNTFFLGMFVREVMGRGICEESAERALEQTVSMVLQNCVFEDGHYSAGWSGPREPESKGWPSIGEYGVDYSLEGRNHWGKGYNNNGLNVGSTPQQIMTSATTAHVLLAAALRYSLENPAQQEPEPEPTEPTQPTQPTTPVETVMPTQPTAPKQPASNGEAAPFIVMAVAILGGAVAIWVILKKKQTP